MTPSVSRDKIEARAYEIWEAEGRPDGKHHEHWQKAHDELAANGNGKAAANGGNGSSVQAVVTTAPKPAKAAAASAGGDVTPTVKSPAPRAKKTTPKK